MQTISLLQYFLFIIVIGLEAWFRLRHEMHEYKIKDTLANIAIAVSSIIFGIFIKGTILIVLVNLQSFSLFEFGTSIFTCVVLFFLSDLIHYGIHYLEHKSRIFWAVHSIHHSSESYNFSVALRTAHTNCMYKFFYEAPLCLLGFDAYQVVMIHNIILFFGFFQHTELVGKLGWLEYIFNTPSHHRVHHASNEKYLDKNFGGVLIIWDKLFGTFQPEDEKPVYGLTSPLKTNNPLRIILHEWIAIGKDVRKSKSWKERVFHIFYKPGWTTRESKKVIAAAYQKPEKKPCKKCASCPLHCNNKIKQNFHSPIFLLLTKYLTMKPKLVIALLLTLFVSMFGFSNNIQVIPGTTAWHLRVGAHTSLATYLRVSSRPGFSDPGNTRNNQNGGRGGRTAL